MAQTHKPEEKTPDISVAAEGLTRSIASLKTQAMENKAARDFETKRLEDKKRAGEGLGANTPVQLTQNRIVPIAYPVVEFGYDAKGSAIKKWMEPVREVIANLDAISTTPAITRFESEIKNIQNSWMEGKPVEPQVMKKKVKELKAAFAEAKLSADDRTKFDDSIAKFDDMLDTEVRRLEKLAHEKAYTYRGDVIARDVLSQEIFYAKLQRDIPIKTQGECELIWRDVIVPPVPRVETTLQPRSRRAYIIVGDRNNESTLELYYTNNATGEKNIKVCEKGSPEMAALLKEMKEGSGLSNWKPWNLYSKVMGNVLTTPGDQTGLKGEVLSTFQEERIRDITHHARRPEDVIKWPRLADWQMTGEDISYFSPEIFKKNTVIDPKTDWKEVLPIAIYAEGDLETEKRLRASEELSRGRDIARDNALDRLKKKQDAGDCVYDYKGGRFKIRSTRDDKGNLIYSVIATGGFFHKTNEKEAMAAMVWVCNLNSPMRPVELTCPRQAAYSWEVKKYGQQLAYAIDAAWEEHKKGIYIGITLDDNAKYALDAYTQYGGRADLTEKANKLYELWKKNVWDKEQQKTDASARMLEETALGKVLVTPPPMDGLGDGQAELSQAFKEKDADKPGLRVKEVEIEVEKLEKKVESLIAENNYIRDKLTDVENEMKKPEVIADQPKLDELRAQKESLRGSHDAVKQDLGKLAGTVGEKGTISNFLGWVRSTAMTSFLGGLPLAGIEERIERMRDAVTHVANMAPPPVPAPVPVVPTAAPVASAIGAAAPVAVTPTTSAPSSLGLSAVPSSPHIVSTPAPAAPAPAPVPVPVPVPRSGIGGAIELAPLNLADEKAHKGGAGDAPETPRSGPGLGR